MSELISVREAARRLGVSDMAVRKAIKNKRIVYPSGGGKLLDWADVQRRWASNSDVTKRSHVGSQGSPHRKKDAPRVSLPISSHLDAQGSPGDGIDDGPKSGRNGAYAQARAVRELYEAKLAKFKYEQLTGKLIDVDEAKVSRGRAIQAAKTRILGIPATCKSRYPDLPLQVVALIDQCCRDALEDLANGRA